MRPVAVAAGEDTDQEDLARLFRQHGFLAIPVVDAEGRLKGIVTIDHIVDVLMEEATEDIQKIGGVEALGEPYLQIRILKIIRKRAGWLAALFLGEMLTATAMSYFEEEISRAVVLALFLPLIILQRRKLGFAGDDTGDPRHSVGCGPMNGSGPRKTPREVVTDLSTRKQKRPRRDSTRLHTKLPHSSQSEGHRVI